MRNLGKLYSDLGGGYLISVSEDELYALIELMKAAYDSPVYKPAAPYEQFPAHGAEPVFKAITDWIAVKTRANQLRAIASEIDNAIGIRTYDNTNAGSAAPDLSTTGA